MKVLIIKTSSMGDVIHTLPAIQDAVQAVPDIEFDWVVEENFREIPAWHPAIKRVIPVALRRWRKQGWWKSRPEITAFIQSLRQQHYDVVIDAQGLFKSALVAILAKGPRRGLDFRSAREPIAACFYQKRYSASWQLHAITRNRQLFAQALHYTLPLETPRCLVKLPTTQETTSPLLASPFVLFLHGTTWATKHWPEIYWIDLAKQVSAKGYQIGLPWGNANEQLRAQRIAAAVPHAVVLPKLSLTQMAGLLLQAKACVAVDTGLGHLAAVLGVPTISLYGPTDPALTGALGQNQIHLQAKFACAPCFSDKCKFNAADEPIFPPCFTTVAPAQVYASLVDLLTLDHASTLSQEPR